MKIEFNNLYTHFIFSTLHRQPLIEEENGERIGKYITGIVNNNGCHLYSIYANPDHTHFLVSRSPEMSEEDSTIVAVSSQKFINEIDYVEHNLSGRILLLHFLYQNLMLIKFVNIFFDQPNHHRKITFTEEYEMFLKFYQKTLKQKK